MNWVVYDGEVPGHNEQQLQWTGLLTTLWGTGTTANMLGTTTRKLKQVYVIL